MEQIILFTFLILFPFGQIIRIGILHPIDVVAGIGAAWAILKHYKKPEIFKYFEIFFFVAAFSWIFSLFIFNQREVLYGGLYLIRLFAYFYFIVLVWNFIKRKVDNSKLLINSMFAISIISGIFGWIQYFLVTDTRPLIFLGWDDHYLRLIGSFLDPTYLGLIIVFGALIGIIKFIKNKQKTYLLYTLFLLVSLAFTYSRASYLAFFAGLFVILLSFKKIKYFLFIALGFLALMFLLPTAKNTTLFFTRAFSAINRVENYKETLEIYKSSPVFGVGYNNICLARSNSSEKPNFSSHSCSGSDSSLLFILATTGVVGLLTFIWGLWNIYKENKFNLLFTSSLLALLIHSLFSNSLVYPWVMGYILIILGSALGSKSKS